MSATERSVLRLLSELALSFDGALLGVTFAIAAVRSILKFASSSKALRKIRKLPELHVSDLISLLPPSDVQNQSDQPIVMVRGTVKPKSDVDGSWWSKVLVSKETGDKAVIVERTRSHVYSNWKRVSQWSYDLRAILGRSLDKQESNSFRMVPFVLVENDQNPQSSYVNVHMDGSDQPLPLNTVYHQLQPISTSPWAFLETFFFPENPIGMVDEEKILPPGKEITAVGICGFKNGVPEIKSCKTLPYFLSELTKDKMILDLIFRKKLQFWSGIVLGCLSIGILGYSSTRGWKKWRLWKQSRQDSRLPPVDDSDQEDTGDIPDGQLCCVCLTRRSVPAFIPCGHIACCRSCAFTIQRRLAPKCPICMRLITGSIRIYYA